MQERVKNKGREELKLEERRKKVLLRKNENEKNNLERQFLQPIIFVVMDRKTEETIK